MPSADTFSVTPIGDWVKHYLLASNVSVDPFARNSRLATHTNDLNPATAADSHKDAREWLRGLVASGVKADAMIFDPPYSPRQVSEVYQSIGVAPKMEDTQTAVLYMEVRDLFRKLSAPGAVCLSFGWNSCGMGEGWDIEEILLVAHGGAHNDTICMAERKLPELNQELALSEGVM